MAPKKQPVSKQKHKPKPSAAASSSSSAAPRIEISSENERRLRRLLLNSSTAPAPLDAPVARSESREQKGRRLRGVYDKLALEGFSSAQIEQALSAIPDTATFESALDWLCFNLPGDELPLKFASATASSSRAGTEGSVKVVSAAKDNWVPQSREPVEEKDSTKGVEMKIVRRQEEDVTLDDGPSSQAAWIRQYMEQQEEEDDANSNDSSTWEDCYLASLEVVEAKPSRRKKKGKKENAKNGNTKEHISHSASHVFPNTETASVEGGEIGFGATGNKSDSPIHIDEGSNLEKGIPKEAVETCKKEVEEEEVELGNMFFEDSSAWEVVAPEILKQQKLEKLSHDGYGHLLGNIDDGDSGKMPKAVLQKFCQKLGWEAPKYSKTSEKDSKFIYAVNVLRGSTGRGKSRKAGGLTKIELPEQDEEYVSVQEAQSRVATFALYQLFADLPLRQLLIEPYSSLVLRWQEGELELSSTSRVLDTEDSRRAGFVDMLLDMDTPGTLRYQIRDAPDGGVNIDSQNDEEHNPVDDQKEPALLNRAGLRPPEQAESTALRKQLEHKIKLPKYQKMLQARASLPIARLKKHFLQLLKENDVIVVSGETGCGKTTQVPQFILDDMIESELGGNCNIVCTQPRRIAAISVAERVSDERCESSPGSKDSLVGYQVRLDSARNEGTKFLFCTTGILFRKLSGNKDLSDVTHVVVYEVHGRTILSDFLLIVLKSLVEKRSNQPGRKLKMILMSATVDSTLFARYFGDCSVISVEGRTHAVSTHFLEDVYEKMDYCLALDSPAPGAYFAQHGEKTDRQHCDVESQPDLVWPGPPWKLDWTESGSSRNPNLVELTDGPKFDSIESRCAAHFSDHVRNGSHQIDCVQIFINRRPSLVLTVHLDEPSRFLMESYQRATTTKSSDLYFAYKNKVIRPHKTPRYYGIGKGSTVELRARTRGGMSSFEEYVANNKDTFTVIVKLPDGNLSLKMTIEGCRFLSSLLSCFTLTFSQRKSWGGKFEWKSHFKISDGMVKIAIKATGSFQGISMLKDIDRLTNFIEDKFSNKDYRLQDKNAPYIENLIRYLKQLEPSIFTDDQKYVILTNPSCMTSYERLLLAIAIQRKGKGLNHDDKGKWDRAMKECILSADWLVELQKIPLFKKLIKNAEKRGQPYDPKTAASAFRLQRDFGVHILEYRLVTHPEAKHGDTKIETFKDDDGVELMLPMHLKDLLPNVIKQLILGGIDIDRELSSAVGRCTSCTLQPFHPVISQPIDNDYVPTWIKKLQEKEKHKLAIRTASGATPQVPRTMGGATPSVQRTMGGANPPTQSTSQQTRHASSSTFPSSWSGLFKPDGHVADGVITAPSNPSIAAQPVEEKWNEVKGRRRK